MSTPYPRWGIQMHGRFQTDGWSTLARPWFRTPPDRTAVCVSWTAGWPLTACFLTRQQARAASARLRAQHRVHGWRFRVVRLLVTMEVR